MKEGDMRVAYIILEGDEKCTQNLKAKVGNLGVVHNQGQSCLIAVLTA
jgi:hypothetical protein